jgi:hypothetical protein
MQLSWSVACLPCSVSIEIQHIRSFFHPFSNQNLEHPQRHLNVASESCFGTCSQSRCSSHTGVLLTLCRCSSRNGSSECASHSSYWISLLRLRPVSLADTSPPRPNHLPRLAKNVLLRLLRVTFLHRDPPRSLYQRWDCQRTSRQNPSGIASELTLLFILSYAGLLIHTFSLPFSHHHDEANHLTTAALYVLAINFITIFITLIY